MNTFYLDEKPQSCAELHCDKHVVKMIIEYAQLLSTCHRVLDGKEYYDKTANGRRIKRWKMDDPRMESSLYKASHVNHPSNIWARSSVQNYQFLLQLWQQLCLEYTYRYGKVHLTFQKLKDVVTEVPQNIPNKGFTQPTQAMPDDCKSDCSLEAYHKYYRVHKSGFAKWTNREVPQFMSA